MHEYSGAIHIHSTYSDGTGTIEQIAASANETGLDYFILTDHNTMRAREDGHEKWAGGTMVIVGYEVNDIENKNHYLVMGTDEMVGTYRMLHNGELGCNLSVQEYVSEIKKKGGVGFIAHPYEKRSHFPEHPAYPWNAWDCPGFDGIEIWNHMSEWVEGLNDTNKVQRFLHPLKSIIAPDKQSVNKWDELNKHRRVSAIGSVDAHAHKMSMLGFYNVEIFAYKILFKSIRTHVLLDYEIEKGNTEKFPEYKRDIIKALKKGSSFIVNSYHGDGKGFRFFADYKKDKYHTGDDIFLDSVTDKVMLNCFAPKESNVRLIKDGICIDESAGTGGDWTADGPGNYRVECWLWDKAWIFSNHIRIIKQ